jgi:hypothetical protein
MEYPVHHNLLIGGGLVLLVGADVIHERFAKHGQAHYRERDRLTRQALQGLAPDDSAGFALSDDLGTGLERLGRSDDAVAVMRDKLARQQANGLCGRDLYTSYANLGTFLIHGSFTKAASGDASAKARCQDELVPGFFTSGIPLDAVSRWPEVSPIRLHMTKVGAESGWENVAVPSHRSPVPFDEPVLGIIGMWRQGGGANPHFALALGETMLRVGQRYIAWVAYEREPGACSGPDWRRSQWLFCPG